MIPANDNNPRLVSLNEAAALTSLSRTSINRLREAGQFPLAVDLGERRIAFVRTEVEEWIRSKIMRRAA